MTLSEQAIEFVRAATGAQEAIAAELVQQLWSGYGQITRVHLRAQRATLPPSVILKWITPPAQASHPRGWNTTASHRRKLESYEIESQWYLNWAPECDEHCRIAQCYACKHINEIRMILLEDLDLRFPRRLATATAQQAMACLQWLACFHAKFLGREPAGLWPVGTYWHLATREEEYQAMTDGELKEAATAIDARLNACKHLSLVHGDAKIANFCFSTTQAANTTSEALNLHQSSVAAVDFQYAGGGCGMKDVAYFIGSCLSESECERLEDELLQGYFDALIIALKRYQPDTDAAAVIDEWQSLYAMAWTDFYRFLSGWMPDHPKVHSYTKKLAKRALRQL